MQLSHFGMNNYLIPVFQLHTQTSIRSKVILDEFGVSSNFPQNEGGKSFVTIGCLSAVNKGYI
jgi:hypothetical protein